MTGTQGAPEHGYRRHVSRGVGSVPRQAARPRGVHAGARPSPVAGRIGGRFSWLGASRGARPAWTRRLGVAWDGRLPPMWACSSAARSPQVQPTPPVPTATHRCALRRPRDEDSGRPWEARPFRGERRLAGRLGLPTYAAQILLGREQQIGVARCSSAVPSVAAANGHRASGRSPAGGGRRPLGRGRADAGRRGARACHRAPAPPGHAPMDVSFPSTGWVPFCRSDRRSRAGQAIPGRPSAPSAGHGPAGATFRYRPGSIRGERKEPAGAQPVEFVDQGPTVGRG